MSYTKQKWQQVEDNKTFIYALGDKGTNIFWLQLQAAGDEKASNEELIANANLIAAAPELLESLVDLATWCIDNLPDNLYEEARKLIESAELAEAKAIGWINN